MLGIKQITTRVAELIRSALPYAIVNNNPNQSMFSRIVSYSEVQHALDAGWKWIQVRASDIDYNEFTVSNDHTTLESCWGARFTNTNTSTGKHVITVSAHYNRLTGFRTYTAGGATSNDRRGFQIAGDFNWIVSCLVDDSDGSGFVANSSNDYWNSFINCHVKDADDYGFYTDARGTRYIGCTAGGNGQPQGFYINPSADNSVGVANITLAGLSYYMASGADDGLLVGNMLDGGTDNNGSGNEITGNKTF